MRVKINQLRPSAIVPLYQTTGASGCDAHACLDEAIVIKPMERTAVPTGLAVEIPPGWEIQVRPRSGLAYKQGLTVVNAPGTIDSDYRGEVKVLVVNLGQNEVKIAPGDRIAQLVLQRVEPIEWVSASELSETARDAGGFGSTGVSRETPHA